jgi:hypothetical protein
MTQIMSIWIGGPGDDGLHQEFSLWKLIHQRLGNHDGKKTSVSLIGSISTNAADLLLPAIG